MNFAVLGYHPLNTMEFDFSAPGCSTESELSTIPPYVFNETQFQYSTADKIGEGGNATVYAGVFNGKQVAIKQVKLDNPGLPRNTRLIMNEAEELLKLDHPNIVKCYGVCPEKGILLLEFADKMIMICGKQHHVHSLRQLIDTVEERFPVFLKYEALGQIATGLEYLKMKQVKSK